LKGIFTHAVKGSIFRQESRETRRYALQKSFEKLKIERMKIFFLSNHNSCRSQMAEAILRSYGNNLEIHSAGIEPADHVSPIAIEVME